MTASRAEAVVIGASAGALEALSAVLPALPAGFRLPIMIVVHLPPDKRSLLAELFQETCRLPVREAEDKEPIVAGTVYFAPPDYHLLIEGKTSLALSRDEPVLLETLSQEGAYAFPPVIVYTGRELTADDEQRLRRYSKSIIIKGAKSPERLLDEVSLFLHQVVSELPDAQQKMIRKARNRDAVLEGRRILVVEDDVRNVYALTNILEPRGAIIEIARNGQEALDALEQSATQSGSAIDLVLMDVMMPVMDGLTATREIRKNPDWKKLPIITLTAKAMPDDHQRCIDAGASDYIAKPLDVEKLLSLVRVWMPR